ncbi:MAG: hypothetical protein Ta2F_15610 [Termitinemataceae bacterium]|nr:MAG: hypothetical protein Ta2F_15610 [Termitinemataceae bacterium]
MTPSIFEEQKQNFYQILGIEKSAGDEEIKRAYFNMVRKFQPDNAPEKFKEIRNAYETLKDKKKREKYDAIGEIPDSIAPLFYEAKWFDHLGKYSKAAELYCDILQRHPELDNVREEYAESLCMDEKFGKAIEVWEELCSRNPLNAHYSGKLGRSYFERGWEKKAETEYKRTLNLDPSAVDAWCFFVSSLVKKLSSAPNVDTAFDELRNVIEKAIKATATVKGNESGKVFLYSYAIISSADQKKSLVAGYFEEIALLLHDGGEEMVSDVEQSLDMIFQGMPNSYLAAFYNEIKKITVQLPNPPDFIIEYLEYARLSTEIKKLKEKGGSKVFYDLFRWLNEDFDLDDEDKAEILAMEFEIIKNKSKYDPELRDMRENFPELYAMHSSFFNDVLRTKDTDKMLYQRAKMLKKYTQKSGYFDEHPESDIDQTIHRKEPKVGRNDPCPCGSGKKYKKCCGA